MKIKGDFITNSSSTNYVFLFKGKTERSLYNAIRQSGFYLVGTVEKLAKKKIKEVRVHCTEDDLIDILVSKRKKIKIKPISEIYDRFNRDLSYWFNEVTNQKKDDCFNSFHFYLQTFLQVQTILNVINFGFTSAIEAEFGDGGGCGLIEGTDHSIILHRQAESLKVYSKDLIIITENKS